MRTLFLSLFIIVSCSAFSQPMLDSVEYIYWGDHSGGTINKAKLDGSDVQTLVSGDYQIRRVRLDRKNRKIYWASGLYAAIRSANYDGTEVTTVLPTSNQIGVIEVDQKNKRLYFTEDNSGMIKRCKIDGTSLETIVTGTGLVLGMAVDTLHDILFWEIIQ
jgi:hypothetical protein